MPLVTAAVVPNSPLLLPGLNTKARNCVVKTTSAINALEAHLNAFAPEVLLLLATTTDTTISGHKYSMLQAPKLAYQFSEFGDLTTVGIAQIALGFTHQLKEKCETSFPIPLSSPKQLPYIFSVPVALLSGKFAAIPIACIQLPINIPLDEITQLAKIIKDHCAESSKRVAILAAGLLARHKNSSDTDAPIFDRQFQLLATRSDAMALLNLDSTIRMRIPQTMWEPASLLYSILSGHNVVTDVLSYESPLGVGLLTASINFN